MAFGLSNGTCLFQKCDRKKECLKAMVSGGVADSLLQIILSFVNLSLRLSKSAYSQDIFALFSVTIRLLWKDGDLVGGVRWTPLCNRRDCNVKVQETDQA